MKIRGHEARALKRRARRQSKNTFPRKNRKNGRGECVFGPHRRKRIAFPAESGQAWLRRSKAGPKRSKPVHFNEKCSKPLQKGMDGSVFGPHRRERIAFLAKFGDARLGRSKVGPGRNKIAHCREKCAKPNEAKTCLDRTGASGSPFLRSYGNHRKPARTYIEPEGKAYVKD